MEQILQINNLNKSELEVHYIGTTKEEIKDYSVVCEGGEIAVYLRDLEKHLIEKIKSATLVVGCVAWLTNERILKALSEVPEGVAIVVQKEDFLRPDIKARLNWKNKLRLMYDKLKEPPDRFFWPGLLGSLSVGGDPSLNAIRCVGNHNRDKSPAFPRMHNKFLVFCHCHKEKQEEWTMQCDIEPYAVWTGSFNFTRNAVMSLENAVFITNKDAVQAFFCEWQQIEALSERLDWSADWCEPEWRIGT